MSSVLIRGDGVAARCCAHLLIQAGVEVVLEPVDRPRLPVIMLNHRALALIRDIFGDPNLFRDAPRIHKRIVAWGRDAKPLALDHSAIVVSEEILLENLSPKIAANSPAHIAPKWTIFALRPLPAPTEEHRCGSRVASAMPVSLAPDAEPGVCWIESLEDGWLFLIPNAPRCAWLLAVGNQPETLVPRSRVIAKQIAQANPAVGQFRAYPRIVSPLSGQNWLACGTAAMAFDPLCGDGTAHAIREAILASAVVRAALKQPDHEGLQAHYDARLVAGFRRHLMLCAEYYRSGGTGEWWRSELQSIEQGLAWCDRKLEAHGEFRYRLTDFELHALA